MKWSLPSGGSSLLNEDRTRSKLTATARGILAIATVVFVAPFLVLSAADLRINYSPSLPLGLYKTTMDSRLH